MDFDLTADQLALRDAARELLDGRAGPARVRAHTTTDHPHDPQLWADMVAQGWLGLEVPEARGGLGLGSVEVAVLAEELGRHCAPAPFLPTVLALGALLDAAAADDGDADADVDAATARLLDGGVGAVAWSRVPDAVRATLRSGAWQLDGRPDPVVAAPAAALAVVVADDGEGPALFLVDLDAVGRPAREPAMDLTRALGWLRLEGTPATRLGGDDAVRALLDRGATFTAAEMLGGAARALELAVDHAKDRVQFGRPIGSFQAVKHRCADMLVDVEGMRSTVYWAAWALGADDPDASVAASTAKTWCTDASARVMGSALQVHGGIGFTWEHDLHFYLKRAQLDRVSFGDATFHRERLGAFLRARVEAGVGIV